VLPGDRLICAFIASYQQGDQFVAWPLHVTVIPWFRVAASTEELARHIESVLQALPPVPIQIGSAARLGAHGRRLVNLIKTPSRLQDWESVIRGFLHMQQAWVVDEAAGSPRAYRPHVTVQGKDRLRNGDAFWCDALYIVEQQGTQKAVVGKIFLQAGGASRRIGKLLK